MAEYDSNDNEIKEKYTEEEKHEWYLLFAEIALLAAKINNETPFCVFFEYSGHVDLLRISIRKSKKNYNEELIASEFNVVLPEDKKAEDENYRIGGYQRYIPLKEMRKKKAFLAYLLENQDIKYDSAVMEEIKHIEEVWSF